MGTKYDKKMDQDILRNELYKPFGQRVSAFTYSTPLYPKDVLAVRDCFLYLDKSAPPLLREIVSSLFATFGLL
jgi:hypothetical protein